MVDNDYSAISAWKLLQKKEVEGHCIICGFETFLTVNGYYLCNRWGSVQSASDAFCMKDFLKRGFDKHWDIC